MRRFVPLDAVAALLDQDSIDTDQVLPSAFMRGVEPDYAAGLFANWRKDPDFVLSRPGWESTAILVSGANFGCGSTREHACWALDAFGIRALIASSYGEVFRENCIKNGILPVTAPPPALDRLRGMLRAATGPVRLRVDLVTQQVAGPGFELTFDIAVAEKTALLDGLDEIGMTLRQADGITAWEHAAAGRSPWLQSMPMPR